MQQPSNERRCLRPGSVVCWSPGRDSRGRIGINHLWKDLAIIMKEQTSGKAKVRLWCFVFVGRLFRLHATVTGQRLTEWQEEVKSGCADASITSSCSSWRSRGRAEAASVSSWTVITGIWQHTMKAAVHFMLLIDLTYKKCERQSASQGAFLDNTV